MFGGLVLALSSAGFLLLIFGERLGLPAEIAAAGVITIFAMMTTGLALVATTSRLAPFLNGGSVFGKITVQTGLLLLAVMLAGPADHAKLANLVVIAIFVLAMLVLPAPVLPEDERGSGKEFAFVAAGCTALMAFLLLLQIWPAFVAMLAACAGISASATTKFALLLLALPLLLGGMSGLALLIRNLILIALVAAVAPSAIEVLRLFVAQSDMALNPVLQLKLWAETLSTPPSPGRLLLEHSRMVLTGLALALVARASIRPPIRTMARLGRMAIALILTCLLAALVAFVLPGGLADPAGVATALAMQYGWPIVIGFIWMMLAPMLALGAIGVLVHAVACASSEMLAFRIFHPRALKAWRLVMARLFCLVLLGGLFWQVEAGFRLDQTFALFAMSGSAFVLICALVMQILRALRRMMRQFAEKSTPPAEMLTATP